MYCWYAAMTIRHIFLGCLKFSALSDAFIWMQAQSGPPWKTPYVMRRKQWLISPFLNCVFNCSIGNNRLSHGKKITCSIYAESSTSVYNVYTFTLTVYRLQKLSVRAKWQRAPSYCSSDKLGFFINHFVTFFTHSL